ncbi:hypothetical protein L1987_39433 [Smallanthus sonchifolius]|uniref:Uncharacterized protein n=1 Tax=Smallanthus sonchifolius TaxID=185202 RepID=A0ACB9HLE8_9ASTR|nr:hypothetical protein L1987_39433 [Smallanthus sonchifolius]
MLKLTQPPPAVLALRNIAEELGKTDWNFNLNPCATTNNSNWATPKQPERPSYNNTVECNCSYTGGVCHVIKIFLKGQDLDGVLPPSLAKLPYIKTIDLTRNYLNGTIPPEWASTNLEYLSLESNMFSGTVPAELGKLENLVNLILNANNLSGELPMELNNLVNLTELRLSSNNFTGRIPNFESLKQLTKLEIHGSGMEGPIPESISLLSNLNELISDLSGESSLFPNLSSMINMTRLYVTGNSLNGSVPSWLTDGSGTVVVDLSYNHFSNETVLPTCGQSLNLFRSYTGWKDSDLAKCLNNFTCLKDYNSAHINCGGIETTIASKSYEADQDPAGPAKFLLSSNQWGFSSTGNVLDLDNYIYTIEDEEKELETGMVGEDSLLKEIDDAFDLNDNWIGEEGLDKHLKASSEVYNNKEAYITAEGEKELKENQEENNFLKDDISDENLESALNGTDDAIQRKDNDMAEKGIEKQLETTSEISKNLEAYNKSFEEKANESVETDKLTELSLGQGLEMKDKGKREETNVLRKVGRYQDNVRSGRLTAKALSRFTNTAAEPICLETEELVQVVEAKKKRNQIEQKTNEKGRKRTREVSEKKEILGKEKMNIGKHKIKINCAIIHQLLGVSCGNVIIESMTKLKIRDESVKAWRNRYPWNFVAPTVIVSKIENAKDEDCFNFRMDFLMCFLAVMVECHGQGRCKEKILDKLTGETDFSNINWCAYIIDSMRGCKKIRKRNDRSVPFLGPLAILTDEIEGLEKLLDTTIGNSEGQTETVDRIANDQIQSVLEDLGNNRDKIDEKIDIENESDDSVGDDKTDTESQEDGNDSSRGENLDEEEKTGDDTYVNAYVENVEEKDSEDKAGMIDEDEKGPEELNESDTIGLGHVELGENHTCLDTWGKKDGVEPAKEIKDTTSLKEDETVTDLSVEEQGKQRITEQDNTSEYVFDGPPFSIGLTQLESTGCNGETKQMEERNLTKKDDGNEDFVTEKEENVLEKRDKVIKIMEEKRRNPMREIGLAIVSKSPYKIRGVDITEAVTKDEELVWEYLFKEYGMMYKLKGKGKVGTDDEMYDSI